METQVSKQAFAKALALIEGKLIMHTHFRRQQIHKS